MSRASPIAIRDQEFSGRPRVVPLREMNVTIGQARLELVCGDIADQDTDAVVTAAHWDLRGGQGTDGAIHFKAGPKLLDECARVGGCPIGGAVLTRGYDLKAPYVIHAVGPIWERGRQQEDAFLASAYQSSLELAVAHGLRSISFPSLSTGAFGYPMRLAAPIAMKTIVAFLSGAKDATGAKDASRARDVDSLILVRMVLYPRETPNAYDIYAEALRSVLAESSGP